MRTTKLIVGGSLAAIAMLGACGGKQAKTTPEESGITIDNTERGDTTDRSGSMFSPEKMDQINRLLARKGTAISRCLTMVVDNQELPKNSRGKIRLAIVISPAGRANDVRVIKTTLDSKALTDCVIGKVQEIQFPELVKPYQTSYEYGVEAIQ